MGGSALKGPLVSAAFRTRTGRGGRFAGHAANEFHEQFRQFEVMNGVVTGQRTDAHLRRIVAASGQYRCHGHVQGVIGLQPPAQPGGHFGEVTIPRRGQITTQLEVTRILGGFTVHQARIGGANEIAPIAIGGHPADEGLHAVR